MEHLNAFANEHELIALYDEDKAYTVWAMGLYLNTSDLRQLANDYLTDKNDDHKIDFLYYDQDEKTLLVVQGYHSAHVKQSAKSNKAADLNAALAWLFSGEINKFNDFMRPKVQEIRDAINRNELLAIELIFAHNCGESKDVDQELKTAAEYLNGMFAADTISVTYKELGNQTLEALYMKKTANITIDDNVECPFPVLYQESAPSWSSVVVTVSGTWLRNLYLTYSTQLFSANYRGYLGESRNKINKGIKNTAEHQSANFWAYNNGITILTGGYEVQDGKIQLHGLSIINGAQTTGSLGQIPTAITVDNVKIMARIIQCGDSDVVKDIVKFNNMQNKITAWDSYGNDSKQLELKREFDLFHYDYCIKRGFDNRDSILNIETLIQPLLAFIGKYRDAGRSKSTIFETRTLYSDAFDHTQARHLLFVSCLSSVLYVLREENKTRMSQPSPSTTDCRICNLFQQLRSRYFLLAIIGESLTRIYSNLVDKSAISLTPQYSDNSTYPYETLLNIIKPIIKRILVHIVGYKQDQEVFVFYNEANALNDISAHVETQIAALRADEDIDRQFVDFGQMLCNG